MLRTTSKQAIENIKKYIMNNADFCDYDIEVNTEDFKSVATAIHKIFMDEVGNWRMKLQRESEQEAFEEWCRGLPSALDTCYYYNRIASDDLGKILEESESDKAKYNEHKAEQMLTWLMFREIKKVVK